MADEDPLPTSLVPLGGASVASRFVSETDLDKAKVRPVSMMCWGTDMNLSAGCS